MNAIRGDDIFYSISLSAVGTFTLATYLAPYDIEVQQICISASLTSGSTDSVNAWVLPGTARLYTPQDSLMAFLLLAITGLSAVGVLNCNDNIVVPIKHRVAAGGSIGFGVSASVGTAAAIFLLKFRAI